jgi:hypothetical protein
MIDSALPVYRASPQTFPWPTKQGAEYGSAVTPGAHPPPASSYSTAID